MTEQQQHLASLLEQRQTLATEISDLNAQAAAKRELALRASGAIEYLQQIGVTVPEEAASPAEGEAAPEEGEVPPTPETEVLPEPTPEG